MNQITKPMLAETLTDMASLTFPVLCTPKLDGFRCLKIKGKALTRKFLPVRNKFVREWIEANCPDGVDGELMLRSGNFNETASAIGKESGTPDFVFYVFDFVRCAEPFGENIKQPYEQRMAALQSLPLLDRCQKILPVQIGNTAELEAYEAKCLAAGYEGVMIRKPSGPYKCGRSTEAEGYLLKLKRFADAEAVVVSTYEGMTNNNEATVDALGHTKRSSAKAGKVGRGELGGFVVRMASGVEFKLGYNHTYGKDRATMWNQRETLVGKTVKFKYQPSGMKDAPRFPSFLGFREDWDMD